MSSFSPKTYQIYHYEDTDLSEISYYYNCFTLLEKPVERNVYKVSLSQMLHYMVDFGIGYNSKCVTTLTTQQQFSLCKYVNRHNTDSPKRPATVADLKKKILDVVEAMVKRTVKYPLDGPEPDSLIKKTNTMFPTYLFTLDSSLTTLKLKQITGHDYVEITDFENFAFTSNTGYNMPEKYKTGYVPLSAVRCVPKHSHETHSKIGNTMNYSWEVGISPQGNSSWANHMANINASTNGGWADTCLGKVMGAAQTLDYWQPCKAEMQCSWEYPSGVSCFENKEKDPVNTKNGKLSIRYHGRRYRLFKKVK